MGRRRQLSVEVDERTSGMSEVALTCRAIGHAYNIVPMGPKRRAELAQLGQVERILVCGRCTKSTTTVYDLYERIQVGSSKSEYPDGYLIPAEYSGQGRLRRLDALVARLASTGDI